MVAQGDAPWNLHLAQNLVLEDAVEQAIDGKLAAGDGGEQIILAAQVLAAHRLHHRLLDPFCGQAETIVAFEVLQPFVDDLLAVVRSLPLALQVTLDGGAGAPGARGLKPEPVRPRRTGVVVEFHQVEMAQHRGRLHCTAVDDKAAGLLGQVGMYVIGVVDDGAALVEGEQLTLGAENVEMLRQRAKRRGGDLLIAGAVVPPRAGRLAAQAVAQVERAQPPQVDLVVCPRCDHKVDARLAAGKLHAHGGVQRAVAAAARRIQRVDDAGFHRRPQGLHPAQRMVTGVQIGGHDVDVDGVLRAVVRFAIALCGQIVHLCIFCRRKLKGVRHWKNLGVGQMHGQFRAHLGGGALLVRVGLVFVLFVIVQRLAQLDVGRAQTQHVQRGRQAAVDLLLRRAALRAAGVPAIHHLLPLAGHAEKGEFRVAVGQDEGAHALLHQRVARPLRVRRVLHDTEIFAAQISDALAAVVGGLGGGDGAVFHKGQQRSGALQIDAGAPVMEQQGGRAATLGQRRPVFTQRGDVALALRRQNADEGRPSSAPTLPPIAFLLLVLPPFDLPSAAAPCTGLPIGSLSTHRDCAYPYLTDLHNNFPRKSKIHKIRC
jgi:hypothetical protein